MKIFNICIYKIKDFFRNYSKYKLLLAILITILLIIIFCIVIFKKSNLFYNKKCENIAQGDDINKKAQEEFLEKQKAIYQKYQQKKLICLTFDDGPSDYTKLLIDGLKQRNVNATFFVLGENISKHSQYVEESYNNGNEIGIHGYSHKLFTRLKNEKIIDEIKKTSDELYVATGSIPKLIRVPYGSLNSRVKEVIKSQNMQSVLWTVDSRDWKYLNIDKDYNYVTKKIKGNDVILMHDTYKPSVIAAFKIIDEFTQKGYMFVTVSQYMDCICND